MQNVLRVRKLEELVVRVVDSRVFLQEDEQEEGEEEEEKRKRKEGRRNVCCRRRCHRLYEDRLIREESQGLPYPKGKEGEGKNGPKADKKRTECGKNGRKARLVRLIVLGSSTRTTRSTLGMAIWCVLGQTFLIFRNSFKLNPSTERWIGKEIEGKGEGEKTKWSQFPDPSSIRKSGLSRVPTDRMQIIELALWTRGLSLAGRIDRKPVGNC
ncbi:hypothetical protein V1478_015935 [Vespula squamosa]|uniref:Uncharacterized protein n=1 Tax=Vespula squamosa TaxID=30214 RepID=A0ABD2A2B1_VESSQ